MKFDLTAFRSWISGKLLKNKTSLLCFVGIMSLQVMFAQTANILISPANTTATVGQSFTVNVRVDIQTGSCNGAEVHLNFNTAYLQISNITKPSSATFSTETVALPAAPYTTANSSGHLEYAAGMPSGSTSTDFNILAITFTPTQAGSTSMSFQNIAFHRTRVALNGIPFTSTFSSGSVSIQNCTPPTAVISGTSASTTCNAQPVSLRLQSATGVGPYTIIVDGTPYSNVSVGSTFTPTPIPFATHRIWPSTDPGVARQNDGAGALEVGNKFRSGTAGFVKGLRFYRGSGTGYTLGTIKGRLWNFHTGALVASITYSGVTTGAAGQWYEAMFSTPVAIAANTTYLVTTYSSVGNYVATDNFFTSGVTSGPLTALDNSISTNGMFISGTEQSGPSTNFANWQSYLSTNYWTDVVFAQNTNSFNLTSITDATGCTNTGALQTLTVTSVDCSTLPVTLLNLSASPNGRKVTLRWSTSSESNNRGFDIERSTDGSNWTTIGFVTGVGNTVSASNYTYLDDNLESRRYYYRLKQMDIDDRSKYSMIVSAVIGSKAEYVLGQNYPNPFRNQTTIQYTLPQSGQVNLSLFDISGRTVKVLVNGTKEAGTHAVSLNTGSLTRGVYYYRIQVGDFTDVKKLTIN